MMRTIAACSGLESRRETAMTDAKRKMHLAIQAAARKQVEANRFHRFRKGKGVMMPNRRETLRDVSSVGH